MQGGIAQTIGLVLAVNAGKRGIALPAFWPTGSIFKFCKTVAFVGRTRRGLLGGEHPMMVEDPVEWLAAMPEGVRGARVRLVRRNSPQISDRNSVAFANGGPVFLAELVGARPPEAWYGEWKVQDQKDPDKRIWAVTYHNFAASIPSEPASEPERMAFVAELRGALEETLAFAARNKTGFDKAFSHALSELESEAPGDDFYHSDMLADGLMDLDSRRLFASCAAAWVFGGMGSWNDLGFAAAEDQQTYERLSDSLFQLVIQGLALAANSTIP